MATLDVSEVISDPLFTSTVTLIKSTESYDDTENPTWSDGDSATVQAVVTADQRSIERLPDALQHTGTILVRFLAADAPEGFGHGGYDKIEWRGRRFIVKDTADYGNFGAGFLRCVCWPEDVSNGGY